MRRAPSCVLRYPGFSHHPESSFFRLVTLPFSDNLFGSAPVLPDGRTSQLAKTRDSTSGPKCSSDVSRLFSSGEGQSPLDPQSPGRMPFLNGVTPCGQSTALRVLLQCAPRSMEPPRPAAPCSLHSSICRGLLASELWRDPVSCMSVRTGWEQVSLFRTTRPAPSSSSRRRSEPGPGAWAPQGLSSPCFPALPGLGPDEAGVTRLILAGLPGWGEPGEPGFLLLVHEEPGIRCWLTRPCSPRPCPSLLGVRLWRSSCNYAGKKGESSNYPDSSTPRTCGQASFRNLCGTGFEEKKKKKKNNENWPLCLLSLPLPFFIARGKKLTPAA